MGAGWRSTLQRRDHLVRVGAGLKARVGLGARVRVGVRVGVRSSTTTYLVLEGLGDARVGGGRLTLPLETLRLETMEPGQLVEHR